MFFSCWALEGRERVGFTFKNRVTNLIILASNLGPYASSGGQQACMKGACVWNGEAYNLKLLPHGTYWQLKHVAQPNQTYVTMGQASPKCANTEVCL